MADLDSGRIRGAGLAGMCQLQVDPVPAPAFCDFDHALLPERRTAPASQPAR